jgi:hypothetical protein
MEKVIFNFGLFYFLRTEILLGLWILYLFIIFYLQINLFALEMGFDNPSIGDAGCHDCTEKDLEEDGLD